MEEEKVGMKWFKWMIWFALFASALSFILGESAFDASVIAHIVAQAVMLIVNFLYFRKRNYMFIN